MDQKKEERLKMLRSLTKLNWVVVIILVIVGFMVYATYNPVLNFRIYP